MLNIQMSEERLKEKDAEIERLNNEIVSEERNHAKSLRRAVVEIEALNAEIERLKAENERLKTPPTG